MNRSRSPLLLQDIPLLTNLPPAVLEALEKSAVTLRLQPQEYLYYQGDTSDMLYVVVEGGIRLVEQTLEGQSIHLKVYSRGDLFGLLAVSGSTEHASGAQAIGETLIVGITGKSMRELIGIFPELGLFVIDHLVNHIQTSHKRIRQLAGERTERRLAQAIVHYATKFGTAIDDIISIDVPLTQKDLADFVGTTPETANRFLKQWEQNGVLRCSRQHIDVFDLSALQRIGGETYMGQTM